MNIRESSDNKTDNAAADETESASTTEANTESQEPAKNSSKKLQVVIIGIAAFLALSALFIVLFGKKIILRITSKYISENVYYEPVIHDYTPPSTKTETHKTDNPVHTEPVKQPTPVNNDIKNILLIGIEEIKGAKNTDAMIIASVDTKKNTLKLVSLMRDLYVQIPGHENNKLNSVYAKGGISLLYSTIEHNFNIKIDNYVLINFDVFEDIIDTIGGIDIKLTKKEADYLNSTNYISNPIYRNVKPGINHMNGNQALGYCRIRKVSTGSENNDFGRTQRHRNVIKAIYEKLKGKNVLQLKSLLDKILDIASIKTDADKDDIYVYLETAIELKSNEIESIRIPYGDNYQNKKVTIGEKTLEVLEPKDWSKTREELAGFIYDTPDKDMPAN